MAARLRNDRQQTKQTTTSMRLKCLSLLGVTLFALLLDQTKAQCNTSQFEGVDYDCCTIISFPGVQSPPQCARQCSFINSATYFSCKFDAGTAQSLSSPCTGGCHCKSAKGGIKSGAISGGVNADCTAAPTRSPTTFQPTASPTTSPSLSPTASPVEAPRLQLSDRFIIKSDNIGSLIWNVSIPSGYMISELAYDSRGNVVGVGSHHGVVAVAIQFNSSDGAVVWTKRFHTTSTTMFDRGASSVAVATSVLVDDYDEVIVSGTSLWTPIDTSDPSDNSNRLSDTFVVKIAPDGYSRWLRTSGNISNDEGVDLSDGGLEWHGSCDADVDPSCLRERWCCPVRSVGVLVFKPATALTQSPTISPTAPTTAPTTSPSCVADVSAQLCQQADACCHVDPYTRGLVRQACQTLCCSLTCGDEPDDSGSGDGSAF